MSAAGSVARRLWARRVTARGPRWWLVYGPVRSGTTLMARLIGSTAAVLVSDWGLGPVVGGPVGPPADLDTGRLRQDLSRNILSSAPAGGGRQLDVVYKQANLRVEEVEGLTAMWGPPGRVICCLRDPASLMASAVAKFPDTPIEAQQRISYLDTYAEHERIGGDVFEYSPDVIIDDYRRFLAPLTLPDTVEAIAYRGEERPDLVTDEMRRMYDRMRALVWRQP